MISKVDCVENMDYSEEEEVEVEEKLPKEVYVIAQELKIIRSLSANKPAQRARQMKKLRRWLSLRSNSSYRKLYFIDIFLLEKKQHQLKLRTPSN